MVCPTNKRKDSELIQEFIRRTGKNHSFGKVCMNTDQICLQSEQKCRFIEAGVIGEEEFVLEGIKTPLLCKGKIQGTVGFAKRIECKDWKRLKKILMRKVQNKKLDVKLIEQKEDVLVFQIFSEDSFC